MNRRDFLKLGALLPFSKRIIKNLIETREAQFDQEFALVDNESSFCYTEWPLSYRDAIRASFFVADPEPIYAPSKESIGGFVEVGRTGGYSLVNGNDPVWNEYWKKEAEEMERMERLQECDCFPGLDIQIRTGHCDTKDILDLKE